MSLNFNLVKIENWQELLDEKTSAPLPLTEAIIFLTIFTGLPEITEKNAVEFACRVYLFELSGVPLQKGETGAKPITLADVRRYIGLHTNATPLTREKFFRTYIWPEIQEKVAGRP